MFLCVCCCILLLLLVLFASFCIASLASVCRFFVVRYCRVFLFVGVFVCICLRAFSLIFVLLVGCCTFLGIVCCFPRCCLLLNVFHVVASVCVWLVVFGLLLLVRVSGLYECLCLSKSVFHVWRMFFQCFWLLPFAYACLEKEVTTHKCKHKYGRDKPDQAKATKNKPT